MSMTYSFRILNALIIGSALILTSTKARATNHRAMVNKFVARIQTEEFKYEKKLPKIRSMIRSELLGHKPSPLQKRVLRMLGERKGPVKKVFWDPELPWGDSAFRPGEETLNFGLQLEDKNRVIDLVYHEGGHAYVRREMSDLFDRIDSTVLGFMGANNSEKRLARGYEELMANYIGYHHLPRSERRLRAFTETVEAYPGYLPTDVLSANTYPYAKFQDLRKRVDRMLDRIESQPPRGFRDADDLNELDDFDVFD